MLSFGRKRVKRIDNRVLETKETDSSFYLNDITEKIKIPDW